MAKLHQGDTMPNFTFDTPFETGRTLDGTVKRCQGKTALLFLRYYGCTLCQYDIHQFAQGHAAIAATGGQMLVVLQSKPALIAGQVKQGELPFDIVCDPEQALYHQFDIAPAKNQLGLVDPKAVAKLAKAKAEGFQHGESEGEELQLPATFILDGARQVGYAHYGASAGDIPTPAELAGLLR